MNRDGLLNCSVDTIRFNIVLKLVQDGIERRRDEVNESEHHSIMPWNMVHYMRNYMRKLDVFCDTIDTNESAKPNVAGS